MPTNPLRLGAAATVALVTLASTLPAQTGPAPASALVPVLEALEGIRPTADNTFKVSNVTLTRGAATFTLTDGRVWPLAEVNGRVIGAVWLGTGRMAYTPPNQVEGERMTRLLEIPQVETTITGLALLFADGTLAELRQGAVLETAAPPGDADELYTRFRNALRSDKTKLWDAGFLEPVLNARASEMFYAFVRRTRGDDLSYQIDPDDPEPVTLSVRRGGGVVGESYFEVVNQAARPDRPVPPRNARRRQVTVDSYAMEVSMPQSFDGGVSFSAKAEMTVRSPAGGYGPWFPLTLEGLLEVDSASWNGTPLQVSKPKDAGMMWVQAPGPLAPDATAKLILWYHGDLLERFGDWFVLKSSSNWYPRPIDGLAKSTFDVTYHTPVGHPLGSVGELRDSSVAGRIVTTHWVHAAPVRNFSFNIGRFEAHDVSVPGSPPVTLLWSEAGHRALGRELGLPAIRNVREVMTDEIASAMKFFTSVYGPPLEPRFFATEIPGGYGEAFPGLVHLSYATFLPATRPGADQVFRAHEVAHQWWGIGVDYASYRDRWLSEGLAEFSGTWYMQTRLGNMERYLDAYRESRRDILSVRERLGATSLGHRLSTSRNPQDYQYGVYQKGAWTMHMLRILLLQLSTMNEDRFTNAMREFYTTYRGRSASTDDLRAVMEKYAGTDLKWFFDEWIDGTGIPTYTWAWKADAANGQTVVRVRVRQTHVPEAFQMYVPVTVELRDGRMLRTRIRVAGPLTETALPPLPGEVRSVRFNDLEGVLAEVSSESW